MDQNTNFYDIAIIGAGPAGYTAAIYAARAGRSVAVFEKASPGGQMGITSTIENYPGFASVEGFELAMKMESQAKVLGAVCRTEAVTAVTDEGKYKRITTKKGEYLAKSLVIATGAKPRLLDVPGEALYTGRGVSYCATCDGMFFRGRAVAVNGGGDTAFEDALYLSNMCSSVTLIHRRDQFRAAAYLVKRARGKENIHFILNSVVKEIKGKESRVSSLVLTDRTTGEETVLECSGLFVAAGRVPETELFRGIVELDQAGYIIAGEDTRTSSPGIFAAGDMRTKTLRQIVTACADGAVAAQAAEEWLESEGK